MLVSSFDHSGQREGGVGRPSPWVISRSPCVGEAVGAGQGPRIRGMCSGGDGLSLVVCQTGRPAQGLYLAIRRPESWSLDVPVGPRRKSAVPLAPSFTANNPVRWLHPHSLGSSWPNTLMELPGS